MYRPDGALLPYPPYYVKGSKLYAVSMEHAQHVWLSANIGRLSENNWVLSYDDCPQVEEMYRGTRIERISARYSIDGTKKVGSGSKEKQELLITKL